MTGADPTAADWSVLVLAGGRATRLDGADKAGLSLGEESVLDTLLSGLPDGVPVVIAGPRRPTARPVTFAVEEVPYGGPVAGIAAALPLVRTAGVVVLAVDAPWSAAMVPALMEEGRRTDASVVVPVTADGRRQTLCSAWRAADLRATVAALADPYGVAVHRLLAGAAVRDWPVPASVEDLFQDIDTPDDLVRARARSRRRPQ